MGMFKSLFDCNWQDPVPYGATCLISVVTSLNLNGIPARWREEADRKVNGAGMSEAEEALWQLAFYYECYAEVGDENGKARIKQAIRELRADLGSAISPTLSLMTLSRTGC